eukprot:jgi/Ulvmu1/8523/UM044_0057.1
MDDISHLQLDNVGHGELLDSLSDPDEDCSYQIETSGDLRSKIAVPPGEFRKYDVLFYCDDEDEPPAEDTQMPVADFPDAQDSESQSTQSASQSHTRSERSPSAERSGASVIDGPSRRPGGQDTSVPMPGWSGIGKGLPGGIGRGVSAGLGMARLQPASANGSLLGLDSPYERGGIGRSGGSVAAYPGASPMSGTVGKPGLEGTPHADIGVAAAGLAELDLAVEIQDVRKLGMSLTAPGGLTLEGLCDRANTRWQNRTVSLSEGTVSAPATSRVRSLARRGSGPSNAPGYAIRLSKRKRSFDNRLRVWSLTDPPAHATIHVLRSPDITLCNGAVALPPEGFWVFQSPEAMLQDVTITGGTVVVCGRDAKLTMTGVKLDRCSVVAVGGAELTMLRCMSTHADVGVFASGPGTRADVRGCAMTACRQGVCVASGAEATLQGLRCQGATITGVEARQPGTKLTMQRCVVGETEVGRNVDWAVRAVFVHSGATADLHECGLWCSVFGLWSEGHNTAVTAAHCKVRNNVRSGALVTAAATVTLQCCTLIGSWEFHGVEVGDVGSSARLVDCVMQRNKRCGVVVYDGATATAVRCTAEGNILAAFKARDCAAIRLEDCVCRNGGVALAVTGVKARGEAVGCTLEESHTAGVQVRAGGAATVLQSTVRSTRAGAGVCVSDVTSQAELRDCRIEGHKGAGVAASQGAAVTAVACSTERNAGCAFFAAGAGSIRAERCVCEGGGKAFGCDSQSTIECVGCEGE